MAQIVDSTVDYAIVGTNAGRPVVNTLSMYVGYDALGLAREEQCANIAGEVAAAWEAEILEFLPGGYTAERIEWVDLGESNGSTGESTGGGSWSWPSSGRGGGGDPYAALVANLVTKATTRRRGQRPGRWYLAPQAESYMSGNNIAPARITTMQTHCDNFLDMVTSNDALPELSQWFPVVTHFPGGTEVGSWTKITALQVRGRVSSQRRRGRIDA